MGVPVLVMGESGSGKSASLRNFSPDDIGIFNVAGKPLPFRKKLPMSYSKTLSLGFKLSSILVKGLTCLNLTPLKFTLNLNLLHL